MLESLIKNYSKPRIKRIDRNFFVSGLFQNFNINILNLWSCFLILTFTVSSNILNIFRRSRGCNIRRLGIIFEGKFIIQTSA